MESKDTSCCVTKAGTFDLIVDEITAFSKRSPDGFTVCEMSTAIGRSEQWCRTRLKKLMAAGRLSLSGSRTMTRIDGKVGAYSPVYKLVD